MDEEFEKYFLMEIEDIKKLALSIDGDIFFDQNIKNLNWFNIGGIVVTDNDELAERVCMIRNHGECVAESKKTKNIQNMVGFNFRMTEIEAAITRCQLKKLKKLVKIRQTNCKYLSKELSKIPAIKPAEIRENCTHSYYILPFKFNYGLAKIDRNKFIEAVKKELSPTS